MLITKDKPTESGSKCDIPFNRDGYEYHHCQDNMDRKSSEFTFECLTNDGFQNCTKGNFQISFEIKTKTLFDLLIFTL